MVGGGLVVVGGGGINAAGRLTVTVFPSSISRAAIAAPIRAVPSQPRLASFPAIRVFLIGLPWVCGEAGRGRCRAVVVPFGRDAGEGFRGVHDAPGDHGEIGGDKRNLVLAHGEVVGG